jgi:hypothetical protein
LKRKHYCGYVKFEMPVRYPNGNANRQDIERDPAWRQEFSTYWLYLKH